MKNIGIRVASLLIILLLVNTVSSKQFLPLNSAAEYYVPGLSDFNFLDLEKKGSYDFYAIIYGSTSYVKAYNESGDNVWNIWLKCVTQSVCAGAVSEKANLIYLDDLDGNEDLDLLLSTSARAEGFYANPFSYMEWAYDWIFLNHKLEEKWVKRDFDGVASVIKTYDLDGDGSKEVLVSSTRGAIYVYGIWGDLRSNYTVDGTIYSMDSYDLNHDRNTEIAAGTYTSVYLMDNASIKWKYPVGKQVTSIAMGETGAPGQAEGIIVASDGERLICLTLGGKRAWESNSSQIRGIVIADMDNDTFKEILVASGNRLKAYGSNGSVKWEYQFSSELKNIKLLSNNRLGASTANTAYLLETNNEYIKNQEAYALLSKAKSFYVYDNCVAAKPLIQEAAVIFAEINNTDGLLECDVITQECERDEETIELGNKYYATALQYYRDKNYEPAKEYVEKAIEVYTSIGYSYGVTWLCAELLENITAETYQTKIKEGDEYYLDAYWAYTNENLRNASELLEKANDIYLEINYAPGLGKSADLRNQIEVKERKKRADEALTLSQASQDQGNYSDSLALAEQAYDLYMELNMTAQAMTASSLKNRTQTYLKAQDSVSRAKQSYDDGNYENATAYATEAKNIYEGLGDYGKSVEMGSFLSETQKRIDENRMTEYLKVAGVLALALTITAIVFTVLKKRKKPRCPKPPSSDSATVSQETKG